MIREDRVEILQDLGWYLGDQFSRPSMYEYIVRLLRKGEDDRAARYVGREYRRLKKGA